MGSVFYLFALIMAPIERELGLSRAQSSLAFSLALLAEGLLAYPVGRLIDQGHERVVMAGGSMLLGVCLLLHSTVTTLAGFCGGDAALPRRCGAIAFFSAKKCAAAWGLRAAWARAGRARK